MIDTSVSRLKDHESSRVLVIVMLVLVPVKRPMVAAHMPMLAVYVDAFAFVYYPSGNQVLGTR